MCGSPKGCCSDGGVLLEKEEKNKWKKNQLLKTRPLLACAFYPLLERTVNDLMSPFSDGFAASIKATYGREKRQADLGGGRKPPEGPGRLSLQLGGLFVWGRVSPPQSRIHRCPGCAECRWILSCGFWWLLVLETLSAREGVLRTLLSDAEHPTWDFLFFSDSDATKVVYAQSSFPQACLCPGCRIHGARVTRNRDVLKVRVTSGQPRGAALEGFLMAISGTPSRASRKLCPFGANAANFGHAGLHKM